MNLQINTPLLKTKATDKHTLKIKFNIECDKKRIVVRILTENCGIFYKKQLHGAFMRHDIAFVKD